MREGIQAKWRTVQHTALEFLHFRKLAVTSPNGEGVENMVFPIVVLLCKRVLSKGQ